MWVLMRHALYGTEMLIVILLLGSCRLSLGQSHRWVVTYSDCSTTCGGGTQVRINQCFTTSSPSKKAPDGYCSTLPQPSEPPVRSCSTQPCTMCDRTYTALSGSLSSPYWPDKYSIPRYCRLMIDIEPEKRILLAFQEFTLDGLDLFHPARTETDVCLCGVLVEVRDDGSRLNRYCGSKKPFAWLSETDKVTVEFITPYSLVFNRFIASYTTVNKKTSCYQFIDLTGFVEDEKTGVPLPQEGFIHSLNFPNAYPDNQNCEYVLHANPEHRIVLYFDEFELEPGPTCDADYVKIEDCYSRRSNVYCGKHHPFSWVSDSNEIWITFRTNGNQVYSGFLLAYELMDRESANTIVLEDDSGSFTSPGYPLIYHSDKSVEYIIHTDPRNLLVITFHDFQLERDDYGAPLPLQIVKRSTLNEYQNHYGDPYSQCLDYVKIIDIYDNHVETYCGRIPVFSYISRSNELLIQFKTDSSMNYRGFNASYRAIPRRVPNDWELLYRVARGGETEAVNKFLFEARGYNEFNPNAKATTITRSRATYKHSDVPDWANIGIRKVKVDVFNAGSIIASFRFDGQASNLSNWFECERMIYSSYNDLNSLSCSQLFFGLPLGAGDVQEFEIRTFNASAGCDSDPSHRVWLDLQDVESPRNCTYEAPDNRLINSIIFVSSAGTGGETALGANIAEADVFTIWVQRDCDERISPVRDDAVSISSNGNGIRDYRNNEYCDFYLSVHPFDRILLEFSDFELEEDECLANDYVQIENTETAFAQTFCGVQHQVMWTTTANAALLRFRTDSVVTYNGWGAFVTAERRNLEDCSTVTVNPPGNVTNPDHPNSLQEYRYYACEYIVHAHPQDRVIFSFSSFIFQTENGPEMQIEDCYSRRSNVYCGKHHPFSWVSDSNEIWITFRTNGNQVYSGFLLASRTQSQESARVRGAIKDQHHRAGRRLRFLHVTRLPTHLPLRQVGGVHHPYRPPQPPCHNLPRLPASERDHYAHLLPLQIVKRSTHQSSAIVNHYGDPYSQCLDYVKIIDIYDNHVETYCGRIPVFSYISRSNELLIQFKTDSSMNYRGFNASYRAIPRRVPNDWELLYRVARRETEAVNKFLFEARGYNEFNPNAKATTITRSRATYKHSDVPDWANIGIRKVKVDVFNAGSIIASFRFDGQASNLSNWFECERMIYSSYNDLNSLSCSQLFFGLPLGAGDVQEFEIRTFNASVGCDSDPSHRVWLDLQDVESPRNCTYEAPDNRLINSIILDREHGDGLCADLLWRQHQVMWTTTANAASLRFRTDSVVTYNGWGAFVTAERRNLGREYRYYACEYIAHASIGKTGSSSLRLSSSRPRITEMQVVIQFFHGPTFALHQVEVEYRSRARVRPDDAQVFTDLAGGAFSSPNYPHPYDSDTQMEYLLHAPAEHLVIVVFKDFSVEGAIEPSHLRERVKRNGESTEDLAAHFKHMYKRQTIVEPPTPECRYDFVRVEDVLENRETTYCGDQQPFGVATQGNEALVLFQTDRTVEKRGFDALYAFEPRPAISDCGDLFTEDFGTLQSPGYPSYYPNVAYCRTVIQVNPKDRIIINFRFLNLEDDLTCSKDYLEVRDVVTGRSEKYCGRRTTAFTWRSDTNLVFLTFVSDNSNSAPGYDATYTTEDRSDEPTCVHNITATSGTIHSPRFPRDYANQLKCEFNITVDEGYGIQLSFKEFELEPPAPGSTQCMYDYLQIIDPTTVNAQTAEKLCGLKNPFERQILFHQLSLIFVSDFITFYKGFLVDFQQISLGQNIESCNEELTGPAGYFSSPGYPGNYPDNAFCIILITVAEGYHVVITFNDFNTEGYTGCPYDYVLVEDVNSGLSRRFCGRKQNPFSWTSESNVVSVTFKSDDRTPSSGFYAGYESKPNFVPIVVPVTGCESYYGITEINGDSAIVQSPDYPGFYPLDVDCFVRFTTKQGSRCEVSFIVFNLEDSSTCQYDFVKVTSIPDGATKKFCGSRAPFNWLSNSATCEIHFHSDSYVRASGYHAEVAAVPFYIENPQVPYNPYQPYNQPNAPPVPYQPSNQPAPYQPYQPPNEPPAPYQPSNAPPAPYQPPNEPPAPYQPPNAPPAPYQPPNAPPAPYQPPNAPPAPYQPPNEPPAPYQPPNEPPAPYQPPNEPPAPYQPPNEPPAPYQPPNAPPAPYQPPNAPPAPYQPPNEPPAPYQPPNEPPAPYQPPNVPPAPYQPPNVPPAPYQPPNEPPAPYQPPNAPYQPPNEPPAPYQPPNEPPAPYQPPNEPPAPYQPPNEPPAPYQPPNAPYQPPNEPPAPYQPPNEPPAPYQPPNAPYQPPNEPPAPYQPPNAPPAPYQPPNEPPAPYQPPNEPPAPYQPPNEPPAPYQPPNAPPAPYQPPNEPPAPYQPPNEPPAPYQPPNAPPAPYQPPNEPPAPATKCIQSLQAQRGVQGSFASPGWPGRYPLMVQCSTTITASGSGRIRIIFSPFQLEGENCQFDYVQISEPLLPGPPEKHCGTKSQLVFESKSGRVVVTFISDAYVTKQGFLATFTQF
nr:cubilin-like [Lytechinus pictus]